MAASSLATNDSSRLNSSSVPEDYSSTKDDSADPAKLLGNILKFFAYKTSF